MIYNLLRPILFKFDEEKIHNLTLLLLDKLPANLFKMVPKKPVQAMGLNFSHSLGLAAGLDKNGDHIDALAKLGFAFIEVGTVTPKPQLGNPQPRLFRLPESQAIINRMGFNNHGVDVLVANVQKRRFQGILGINIGKNKDTSLTDAAQDYIHCLQKVYTHASYVTINISSPNTPDLRQLQQGEFMRELLTKLRNEQLKLRDKFKHHVPLVIKVSPDENAETLKQIAATAIEQGFEGIIATNTTSSRPMVQSAESGGLSGQPVFESATASLRLLKQEVGDAITLIGVGGIDSVETAREKIAAGATLLQIYTGLIYKGPQLVSDIAAGL